MVVAPVHQIDQADARLQVGMAFAVQTFRKPAGNPGDHSRVVGRVRQTYDLAGGMEIGHERRGVNEHMHCGRKAVLPTQFLGGAARVKRYPLQHRFRSGGLLAERAGAVDLFLRRRDFLQGDAGAAVQFLDGPFDAYAGAAPDGLGIGPGQVMGGCHTERCQALGQPVVDPPHARHGGLSQDRLPLFRGIQRAAAPQRRILLGGAPGELGQCLGGGDTDTDRHADLPPQGVPDLRAILPGFDAHPGQGQEHLVNGVHLDLGTEGLQRHHHPVGDVAVERVVGRKDRHAMLAQQALDLEKRLQVRDAQRLGLPGAGYDKAVVVGQDHHGLPPQVGTEDLLAARVEAVAVNEGEHGGASGSSGSRRPR